MDERVIAITGAKRQLTILTNLGRVFMKNLNYDGWNEIELPELKKKAPKPKNPSNHKIILLGPGKTVSITEGEKEILLKEMTEAELEEWGSKLESYQARTGKKYASHYLTMLNWHRRDKENNKNKNGNIQKREL